MLQMLRTHGSRFILICFILFSMIVTGDTAYIHIHSSTSAPAVPPLPVRYHKNDWLSPAYYAAFHPQKMTQHPLPKQSLHPLPASSPQAGTTQAGAGFNIWFNNLPLPWQPVDASNGVPLTLCVTQYSSTMNGAALGQNVYLTSASGGAFAPSVAGINRLDGCAEVTYYAPRIGTNILYAAINYVTPDFNAFDSGQAISTYTSFPYVREAQIDVGLPSIIPSDILVPKTGTPNVGETAYSSVDESLPMVGHSVSLARTYNSARLVDSPFGLGWSSTLSQSITFPAPPAANFVDNLNDWSSTYSHTANLTFDRSNPYNFNGDTSRIVPTANDSEDIVWAIPTMGLATFQATTYLDRTHVSTSLGDGFLYYTSNDGSTWSQVTNPSSVWFPYATTQWVEFTDTFSITSNVKYVKLVVGDATDPVGVKEIGKIQITYSNIFAGVVGKVAMVNYADGHSEYYSQSGSNWIPEPNMGITSTLSSDGNHYLVHHLNNALDVYSSAGQLQQVLASDGTGFFITYSSNQVVLKDFWSSRGWTFTLDGQGHVTMAVDNSGETLTYTYQGNLLVSFTRQTSDPRTISYGYDGAGRLTSVNDSATGGSQTYTYDPTTHFVTSITTPNGTSTFSYDLIHGKTTILDSNQNSSALAVDGLNRPVSITDGLGIVTNMGYDINSHVNALTDGNGNTTLSFYDVEGDLTTLEDGVSVATGNGSGHTSTWTYDQNGHVLTAINANRRKTTYTYDGFGHMTTRKDPAGGQIAWTYGSAGGARGQVIAFWHPTIPKADEVNYVYTPSGDLQSKLIRYTDAQGQTMTVATWSYTEDADGRILTITDPANHTTTIGYNGDHYVSSYMDADGNKWQYGRDAAGRLTSVTYQEIFCALPCISTTVTTNYSYDASNELTMVKTLDGATTRYTYDGVGNLTAVTDGNNHTTSYHYDERNKVIGATDALGYQDIYYYDGNGNVALMKNARNQWIRYDYDQNNNLVDVKIWDSSTPEYDSVRYSYDGVGNRVSMMDVTGTTIYGYDSADRLHTRTDGHGNTVIWDYDINNNITRVTYPDGFAANYAYDQQNRLSSVTDWNRRVTSYSYLPTGYLGTITYPNNTVLQFTYDPESRPEYALLFYPGVCSGGAPCTIGLTSIPDNVGNVSSDNYGSYLYDSTGRLKEAIGSISYTYDNNGNITQTVSTGPSDTSTYTYNAADELQTISSTANGTTTFQYDADGNMTSRTTPNGTTTYVYNALNQLVSDNSPHGTDSYTYNGDGMLVLQNGTWYIPTQDGQHVLASQNGSQSQMDYLYGYTMTELAQGSGNPYFYYEDASGNVMVTGGLDEHYYSPFGVQFQRYAWVSPTIFQMHGEQVLDNGLINLRGRFYDPSLGRFIQRDTYGGRLTDPRSLNRYVYANDNPLNNHDATGHDGDPNTGISSSYGGDASGGLCIGSFCLYLAGGSGYSSEGNGYAGCGGYCGDATGTNYVYDKEGGTVLVPSSSEFSTELASGDPYYSVKYAIGSSLHRALHAVVDAASYFTAWWRANVPQPHHMSPPNPNALYGAYQLGLLPPETYRGPQLFADDRTETERTYDESSEESQAVEYFMEELRQTHPDELDTQRLLEENSEMPPLILVPVP